MHQFDNMDCCTTPTSVTSKSSGGRSLARRSCTTTTTSTSYGSDGLTMHRGEVAQEEVGENGRITSSLSALYILV